MECPKCSHMFPLTWKLYFKTPFGNFSCPACSSDLYTIHSNNYTFRTLIGWSVTGLPAAIVGYIYFGVFGLILFAIILGAVSGFIYDRYIEEHDTILGVYEIGELPKSFSSEMKQFCLNSKYTMKFVYNWYSCLALILLLIVEYFPDNNYSGIILIIVTFYLFLIHALFFDSSKLNYINRKTIHNRVICWLYLASFMLFLTDSVNNTNGYYQYPKYASLVSGGLCAALGFIYLFLLFILEPERSADISDNS